MVWGTFTLLAAAPLFFPDVLAILERRCQTCHRAGEIAPMPLETYEQTRPYARAIRDAVLRRTMPPWFADGPHGTFANDPRLTTLEIDTIRRWVAAGAPRGKDTTHAPKSWPSGWRIGKPDAVFAMPQPVQVPASGELDYQHIIVPTGFTADRWVTALEIRPSSRAHVHHAVVFVRPPRSVWLRSQPPGRLFTAKGHALAGLSTLDEAVATFLPGAEPVQLPPGYAKLIPAGSDLIFQIHYTANGVSGEDRTSIGLTFAAEPPRTRVYSLSIAQGDFVIPPRAPAFPVRAEFQVQTGAAIIGLAPHMHLRGKSMRVRAIAPDDTERELLHVPRYDFQWQLVYRPAAPIPVERGTRIVVDAVFDNSPNNPRNPDPSATVRWGEQSREEMAVCFVDFLLPVPISPTQLFRSPFPHPR
ncbi:MAG TPA: thiol-disulfide isomerase [Bryobacteraceae bacterium]|nr:thiol-disulfide isomerase [Bryobacteraceae bacterium]